MQAENIRLMEELKEMAEQNKLKKSMTKRQKLEINTLREENQQLNVKNGKFTNGFEVISMTVQQIEVMKQQIFNLKKGERVSKAGA